MSENEVRAGRLLPGAIEPTAERGDAMSGAEPVERDGGSHRAEIGEIEAADALDDEGRIIARSPLVKRERQHKAAEQKEEQHSLIACGNGSQGAIFEQVEEPEGALPKGVVIDQGKDQQEVIENNAECCQATH